MCTQKCPKKYSITTHDEQLECRMSRETLTKRITRWLKFELGNKMSNCTKNDTLVWLLCGAFLCDFQDGNGDRIICSGGCLSARKNRNYFLRRKKRENLYLIIIDLHFLDQHTILFFSREIMEHEKERACGSAPPKKKKRSRNDFFHV